MWFVRARHGHNSSQKKVSTRRAKHPRDKNVMLKRCSFTKNAVCRCWKRKAETQNVGIALEPLRAIVAEKEEMSGQRIGELEKCTKTQIDKNLSKNAKTPTVKKERVSKHAEKTKVKERPHRERRPPVKESQQNKWKENRFLQSVRRWRFCGTRRTWKAQIGNPAGIREKLNVLKRRMTLSL